MSIPPCPHRPPCPACPRYGELGIAGAMRERLAELARVHGLTADEMTTGPHTGFRSRARLAVRGRVGTPKVGLFEQVTHRVVHIPTCKVQHPLINHVASVVRRALAETRMTSYSDAAHLGLVRHLQVVIERSSETAQVVVVANSATVTPLAACMELIRSRLGDALHSLWFSPQQERSNVVLGAAIHPWCGRPTVIEHFGGPAIHYPPGAFGQSNLHVAQAIIGHIRERVPWGAKVVEFYAGVGAIGLSILDRSASLSLNEASPYSLEGLEQGLRGLDPLTRAKATVNPGLAAAAAETAVDADLVIVDPPRKGLEPELAGYLAAQAPPQLLYVSCGLDALIEDTRRLTSGGRLRLVELTAFNLLPFTEHVETVARFERRSAA